MKTLDYSRLFALMENSALAGWLDTLPADLSRILQHNNHGKFDEWLDALAHLPAVEPENLTLKDEVRVETAVSPQTRSHIEAQLRRLHPWRKGPFFIHGLHIDSEWRSDWKWERVKAAILPLKGRTILDVGCGNGYYGWRMVGEGARLVIGIDPFLLYVMQYHAVRHFLGQHLPAFVLPLGIENLPAGVGTFDTVFSMGVLSHRRSPFDHLLTLHDLLRPDGQLVLETLVIEGELGQVLVPEGRYAQMRNVWFLPTSETLASWLVKSGFTNIKEVDVTLTTQDEQRSTDWMTFHSLSNFLDPQDPARTVEGHPAPRRAILTAQK